MEKFIWWFSMTKIQFSSGEIIEAGNETVLAASLKSGLGFPYECNSGSCGICKFVLNDGDVENLYPDAKAISERDKRKNRMLACQCKALTDLDISVNLDQGYIPKILPKNNRGVIRFSDDLVGDIKKFSIELEEDFDFLPGQYGLLEVPGIGRRAYSMANIPSVDDHNVEFYIKKVEGGIVSEYLFDDSVSSQIVNIEGPYGLAHYRDNGRDIICVAGGSGLAPMVSIAREFSRNNDDKKMKFLFGARSRKELLSEVDFAHLIDKNDSVEFIRCVSHETSISDGEEAGYLHEVLMKKFEQEICNFDIYCAGPPPMVNAIESILDSIGFPRDQLYFDRFY